MQKSCDLRANDVQIDVGDGRTKRGYSARHGDFLAPEVLELGVGTEAIGEAEVIRGRDSKAAHDVGDVVSDARVREVRQHEVDDAVAAAERHRRLGAVEGQREKSRALATCHHQ